MNKVNEISSVTEYNERANKYRRDLAKYQNKDLDSVCSLSLPISTVAGGIAGAGLGAVISRLTKVNCGNTNLGMILGGGACCAIGAAVGSLIYIVANARITEKRLNKELEYLKQFEQSHKELFRVDA